MSWGPLIEQSLAADLLRGGAMVFIVGLLVGVGIVLFLRRAKR